MCFTESALKPHALFPASLILLAFGAAYPRDDAGPVTAEVQLLVDGDYFPRVLALIAGARTEVFAVLYLVGDPVQERPKALLGALAAAQARGVEVSVLLDREADEPDRNAAAAAFLEKAGVRVRFDEPDRTTHAKALVVDAETVVLGSANWTQAALKHNREAGAEIRSRAIARRLRSALGGP